jgi:copper chaperone CopZ
MNETRATLSIEGMSCQHCVKSVRQALEDIHGVEVESVEIGTAIVKTIESVSPDTLRDAIDDIGFEVVEVS